MGDKKHVESRFGFVWRSMASLGGLGGDYEAESASL